MREHVQRVYRQYFRLNTEKARCKTRFNSKNNESRGDYAVKIRIFVRAVLSGFEQPAVRLVLVRLRLLPHPHWGRRAAGTCIMRRLPSLHMITLSIIIHMSMVYDSMKDRPQTARERLSSTMMHSAGPLRRAHLGISAWRREWEGREGPAGSARETQARGREQTEKKQEEGRAG